METYSLTPEQAASWLYGEYDGVEPNYPSAHLMQEHLCQNVLSAFDHTLECQTGVPEDSQRPRGPPLSAHDGVNV